VIQVQDWAEIRHLYFAEELSQRAIAERLGVARKTVGLRLSFLSGAVVGLMITIAE
jgi:DNA-binding transcriptional regulator LsrR (DeoR family)